MKITEVCVRKPVFAWMLMAATVVFGGIALTRIGISQFPDVDFPTITVALTWEGAAPEVVEHDLVEPIEEAVMQVEGVRAVNSVSRQGSATVTVELHLSRNVDLALQDVQTKVSQAQMRLPKEMDPPVISKTNPEDNPIMWVGLSGPFPRQVITDYARYRIKEKLQTVPGVGEVMLGGYLERNVRLWLDANRLNERGLTVTDVTTALRREHVELPAGRLETDAREVNVRVLGEALDLDALRRLVIREEAGRPIYLSDVALVEDGFEDERRFARVNGQPAQGMGIKKQRGANAVGVANGVKKLLTELQSTLPAGMQIGVNFDSTVYIRESVEEIRFELLLAVLLTAFVCWLFLGSLSSTLNILLAIPMSLLGTIATIYFLGFTLNTFTLLALSLAVGIVVDDAIMVLENIYRHFDGGKDRVAASLEGTQEISFAALAATLAVVAIFIPVVFMPGIIGKFFLQFGVTLSVAVLLSYVEAVTLAPARCAQILRHGAHEGGLAGLVSRFFQRLSHGYRWLLERGLRRPLLVVLVGVGVFAGALALLKRLPSEFVPSQDQGFLMVRLQTAVASNIRETDLLMRKAEAVVGQHPAVRRYFGIVGGFGGTGVNTGVLFTTLKPRKERALSQKAFAGYLRGKLNGIPGLKAVVMDLSQSGFSASRGFPVEFSVRGPDWDKLVTVSQALKEKLTVSGLLQDADSDYQLGIPELRITPERARSADLGVPIEAVATTLNALVGGVRVGKYSSGGRRVDVRLRLLAAQRSRPEDLTRLRVRTSSGELVPLSSLVSHQELPALQAVMRRDRERAITLFGNVGPGHSQGEVIAEVERLGRDLPAGYHLVLEGASVTYRESGGGLLFALFLGIAVAYMILASQFNSFLHPITVLTILPLSVAGAAAALTLGGQSLNMMSMIGILLLMGIVKKNSIILVDYATQLRRQGHDAREAMLGAGPIRLRPILMTSVATLMAALPFMLGLGPGSEVRRPMGLAVVGGVAVSTALSLLVVPAFYVLADRWRGKLARLLRRKPRTKGSEQKVEDAEAS
ncbi:MAG: efflux RND transporter permease subunit [Deltaproteobacteria bacterium]|nr:efflux RND transporter permease subunit [Deltaproteobacteria bacterium]